MSDDYKQRQALLIAERAKASDIVITTALIPGRPAPVLVTADTVAAMKPGSVVVDLAVKQGGNCQLSVADTGGADARRREDRGALQPARHDGGRRQRALRAQPAQFSRRCCSTPRPAS